jgi:hypothetical protein
MEAVPVAQVAAAVKKNKVVYTQLIIVLIELDLLLMDVLMLKRKKYSENKIRNDCIRIIISINEKCKEQDRLLPY